MKSNRICNHAHSKRCPNTYHHQDGCPCRVIGHEYNPKLCDEGICVDNDYNEFIRKCDDPLSPGLTIDLPL